MGTLAVNQDLRTMSRERSAIMMHAAFERLLGLHDMAYLVLFLIFLTSFRNFGLRNMQYNLLTE